MSRMKSWKRWLGRDQVVLQSRELLSPGLWGRRLLFWGGGVAVGLVAIAFAVLCDHANIAAQRWYKANPDLPLLVTPFGFMLIIIIKNKFFQGTEGSGIPQVMAALNIKPISARRHLVSIRIAIGKFFLTIVGFWCGGSLGREGPTVQLSASIMHALGAFGQFNRHDVERGLLLAGGAAGISAAFNTPLAGIIFVIEELSGAFERGISGTIITTVVLGGIIVQSIHGNYTYFGTSTAHIDVLFGLYPIIVCAVLGGLLGGIFSVVLIRLSGLIRPFAQRYPVLLAGTIGFGIAVLGVLTHGETYGSGYVEAKALVTGEHTQLIAGFGFFKILANTLTYLSGIPGGLLAPTLSAGAGVGSCLSVILPHQFAAAVIVLGMVAYFSGVMQSPITCFVIVSEMTANLTGGMLIPIMLTSILATASSRLICHKPLYQQLMQRYLAVEEPSEGTR